MIITVSVTFKPDKWRNPENPKQLPLAPAKPRCQTMMQQQ